MAIYSKIEGIPGEVTAKGHEAWIELTSITFNVNRIISTEPGRISSREGTRPSISTLTLTKKLDKSSPLLFSEACVGKAKSQIEIHICQTGDSLSEYLAITLSNVIVSSYRIYAEDEDVIGENDKNKATPHPCEKIDFSFDKIELRYTPYDNNNQPQSPITSGYDLKQALAS